VRSHINNTKKRFIILHTNPLSGEVHFGWFQFCCPERHLSETLIIYTEVDARSILLLFTLKSMPGAESYGEIYLKIIMSNEKMKKKKLL